MARLCRGQSSTVAVALALLFGLLSALPARPAGDGVSASLFYDQPVLVVDPGMHTAAINEVGVDGLGRFAATASDDKTVRIWSLDDGRLLQTIRPPAGPGEIGNVYAVAIDRDGELVAAGGY